MIVVNQMLSLKLWRIIIEHLSSQSCRRLYRSAPVIGPILSESFWSERAHETSELVQFMAKRYSWRGIMLAPRTFDTIGDIGWARSKKIVYDFDGEVYVSVEDQLYLLPYCSEVVHIGKELYYIDNNHDLYRMLAPGSFALICSDVLQVYVKNSQLRIITIYLNRINIEEDGTITPIINKQPFPCAASKIKRVVILKDRKQKRKHEWYLSDLCCTQVTKYKDKVIHCVKHNDIDYIYQLDKRYILLSKKERHLISHVLANGTMSYPRPVCCPVIYIKRQPFFVYYETTGTALLSWSQLLRAVAIP